ncbi:tRNA pseudouridine(38-40) synthase TruA [Pseudomonas sp. LRF_L74]|uniref:tRNA pseudouridine(38-40) synthase TruA n=1 Tax=Pseudomonas sp. LRF_L74 TaxID=3369422 RepID=UPI003F5F273B
MPHEVPKTAAEEAAVAVYRIALGVEYKGSRYRGFQRQRAGVPSIQERLETALSKVAGGAPVTLSCAGRTDALVHASGQIVHFDTTVERTMHAWTMGANLNLPPDISVTWARSMPLAFDARFSAKARRYRYVIYNDQIRPAHMAEEVTWNHRPLDIQRMREAARHLVGTHDFSAFRARQCQAKSPIKTVHHLEILEWGRFLVLDIRANAFLHHMVRNFAGVLMTIASGERPVEWAREVLESRVRRTGGVTAHPYGLYLVQVEYPDEFELPQRYLGPHFLSGLPDVMANGAGPAGAIC